MHLIKMIYNRGGIVQAIDGSYYFDADRIKKACLAVGLSQQQAMNLLLELGTLIKND